MHRDPHALGHQMGTEHADLGQERGELIAADARHHVPASHQQSEGMTDHAQQGVAGGVTLGIVDLP